MSLRSGTKRDRVCKNFQSVTAGLGVVKTSGPAAAPRPDRLPAPCPAAQNPPGPVAWRDLSSMPPRLAVSTLVPAPARRPRPRYGGLDARRKGRSRPVSRVLSWTVIPLGAASPRRSSNLPGPDAGRVMRSLFGLAPGGVCRAGLLPGSRCALTAPFHPCPHPPTLRWDGPLAVSFCCTFRRLAPPRRYLAPCPVEPGLSSASRASVG